MKTMKKNTILLVLVTGFGLLNVSAQEKESPRLYAVLFHADYCSVCKAISPTISTLKQNMKEQDVKFVKFDFTNKESEAKSKELAKSLGLSSVLESNRGTGYVVLIDAKTKEEKGKLTRKQSADEMAATIEKVL
jgi:thiol-disulfide isomerase/thioredoxin